MKTALIAMLALVAAAIAPAAVILVPYAVEILRVGSESDPNRWAGFENLATLVLATSFLYVLVLGLPSFLILRWRKAIRWWSSVALGFLLGCLPVAVDLWPGGYGDGTSTAHWDGQKMAQTIVDGVPTLDGWLSYTKAVAFAFMGVFGAIGGLAFWLVWRGMQSNKTMEPTR